MSTDRAPASRTPAGLTTEAIASSALDVIRDLGVAGLTMRALAERLGVRAPSLYHHVRGKDDLLALVAANAFGDFGRERAAYARVDSLDEWLRITARGTLRLRAFYAEHPGLAGVMQASARPGRDLGDDTRALLARAQIEALVRLGLSERVARETFEATARWTLAAVAAEATTGADDRLFRRGLTLLMAGIRADLDLP